MTETIERTASGAILYDQSIINQISEDRFTAEGWLHSEPLTGDLGSGGRGNTLYVGNVPRQFVMRHYVRGGMMAKLVKQWYFWGGEDATRSFAEWRMLAKMADFDLPVPRPAAARYIRRGTFYKADIITVRIPNVRPLSSVILEQPKDSDFWANVGAAIQQFHASGVYHPDMSAHNIQIDKDDRLWMLDFDKGLLRQPGAWQQATLGRLHRSLQKILSQEPRINFGPADWEYLLEGYFSASRGA